MSLTSSDYRPEAFDSPTDAGARWVILTPEAGLSSEERWTRETAYLKPYLDKLPNGVILDYGCGIGRLSKGLIDKGNRVVMGVDISPSMLKQAANYLGIPRLYHFVGFQASIFESVVKEGMYKCDGGIAVWSLQHVYYLATTIATIAASMKSGAPFLLVNRPERFIPVQGDGEYVWASDTQDLDAMMDRYFTLESEQEMPHDLCAPGAYLRWYRRV
jgi:SAM-dependent methyltransferase